ncbi:hypothetical protein GCM10010211_66110 [Streptomyces albospinus]|uniref:MarR family transcriptional regulator n=1 Tax=Streptomyces albospinus TaxID=285515 RepID=A0ABQ2VJ13_9ACTN|nr:hypothetical protein [Streptomyces albospinus]GGU90337.1 hypothetical protein GCM10010211_66110 [Streptomyces albospinus]
MSAGGWSRWCGRAEEAWHRHVRYRELYRQLDLVRAELRARTAWVDELTEEEVAEVLRGLGGCVDAMRAAGGEAPDRPEGAA